jgi:hypothetical protein
MQAVHAFISIAVKVLVAAALSCAAFVLALWAMRPFEPLSAALQVTEPELLVALVVAALVFAAAAWRLLRGGAVEAEVGKFTDAALGDDHLG